MTRVAILTLITQLGLYKDRVERLQAVKSELDDSYLWVALAVFVLYCDPEEARDITDLFWVVEQQLLVKVGVLAILNHDGHHLVGVSRL